MHSVELQLDYWILEFVPSFGELNEVVSLALRRYFIDELLKRIEPLKGSIMKWETQYSMTYDVFHAKIVDGQVFLYQLNQKNPMWEADLLEWASQQQEFDQWMKQLESILKS